MRDIDDAHHMNMRYTVAIAHKISQNSFGDPASLAVTDVLDAGGSVRAKMHPDAQPVTEENLAQIVDSPLGAP